MGDRKLLDREPIPKMIEASYIAQMEQVGYTLEGMAACWRAAWDAAPHHPAAEGRDIRARVDTFERAIIRFAQCRQPEAQRVAGTLRDEAKAALLAALSAPPATEGIEERARELLADKLEADDPEIASALRQRTLLSSDFETHIYAALNAVQDVIARLVPPEATTEMWRAAYKEVDSSLAKRAYGEFLCEVWRIMHKAALSSTAGVAEEDYHSGQGIVEEGAER